MKDHVFTKSRKHTQPTKKLDYPVKFCVKRIYRFTSQKVGIFAKNNREKINQNLRNDLKILKKKKKNFENLGSLQYLVLFPNENQHRFHYQGEATTVIQPVDSRVNDFICKQIKEGCRVSNDIQSRTDLTDMPTNCNILREIDTTNKIPDNLQGSCQETFELSEDFPRIAIATVIDKE